MIGDKIKELREEKNLTQETLSKAIGISRASLCHYEIGRRQIPNELLPKLADFFDVTIDYLFGREEY